MANPIVDFNSLYVNWNQDCLSQAEFINRLKLLLQNLTTYVDTYVSDVVQLSQTSEPTQLQWEQAWVAQTGKDLPINPSAILLWYDTANLTFGGQYGTTVGRSTVYRREPLYPKGATVVFTSAYLTSAQTLTTDISANRAVMPSLSFTINQPCDVMLSFELYTTYSGAGSFGLDFEINGAKVGTTYFGIAANGGLVSGAANMYLKANAPIFNLPAGTYTVQSLYGVVGAPATPPTLTIGGTAQGIRLLTVKAIAR